MMGKLEKVFILRHGNDKTVDFGEACLTEAGLQKTEDLTKRISVNILDGEKGLILTSSYLKAVHTAIVISNEINCGIKAEDSLTYGKEDEDNVLKIISSYSKKVDFIIIVGHMGLAESLPFILINENNKTLYLDNSEGVKVDLLKKEINPL